MNKHKVQAIVIGGGAAGLSAAVTLAEAKISVCVLEKMNKLGGCTNLAVGLLGVETDLQKKCLIDITRERAFQKFMDYTHWRANALLVRKYLYKSAQTISWLGKMGVEFALPSKYFPGSEATWHLIKPKNGQVGALGAASTMIRTLHSRLKDLGGQISLNTTVKSLKIESGKIIGVVAEKEDKGLLELEAECVIVCTGGFGDSPEFIKEYTEYEYDKDLFSYRVPGLKGEGIKMAWAVGAAKSKMDMELVFFAPHTGGYAPVELPFRQPNLLVNLAGERFMNESIIENPVFSVNAIARQKNRMAFSIIDDSILEGYEKNGLDLVNVVTANMSMENFKEAMQIELLKNRGVLYQADNIAELADKLNINANKLQKTISEYNSACYSKDELFDKNSKYLKPLLGPKFYALKFAPSAYGSLGGIKTNHNMEVLDNSENVIPGLYAAGTDANSICDPDYVFILPGNSLGFAVNSGIIAAETAIENIRSEK